MTKEKAFRSCPDPETFDIVEEYNKNATEWILDFMV